MDAIVLYIVIFSCYLLLNEVKCTSLAIAVSFSIFLWFLFNSYSLLPLHFIFLFISISSLSHFPFHLIFLFISFSLYLIFLFISFSLYLFFSLSHFPLLMFLFISLSSPFYFLSISLSSSSHFPLPLIFLSKYFETNHRQLFLKCITNRVIMKQ